MVQRSNPPVPPPPNEPPSGDQPVEAAAAPAPAPERPIHEWTVLGAGIAAVIGSFLPWAKISAPIVGTISMSGVDGSDGWITAGLGLILVLYAGMSLRGQRMPVVVPILAVLAALGLFGVGAWKIADLQAAETAMRAEMSGKDDVLGIGKAMSAATQMSVGSGLWLLTFAGLVGTVTMVLIMISRYRGTSK
ncbi:hypothetical protein GA0070624_4401 [Micromonospora rhizosphaerae]|uniref:Tryptophan-associated transmembrane protein (Trp_oprn_chp) n=1 Tax=Micromonospora rhizosphaerae TaxID=568872 RepID=A0A1C6SRZ1_9ACTN|nr:hypothetical protein [Micromonospora rhizosphaerae]SCL32112.1 hypothetical protein GA0070624_4401 [Micromonospora rhizosphaerae]